MFISSKISLGSVYLVGVSIFFVLGVFLGFFGIHSGDLLWWVAGSLSVVLIWFWDDRSVRMVGIFSLVLLAGYVYTSIISGERLINLPENWALFAWLEAARNSFTDALRTVIPEPQASLAAGLVVGTKGGFSAELKEMFINTGVIHLVAVSGFNITVVLKIFSEWLKYLGRTFAFWSGTLAIVAFVVLVGGQASVVRAGVMGWLFMLVRYKHRLPNIRNALFLTGLLMVLQEPKIVVEDIGFQLSFVSMLGLVYISPILDFLGSKVKFIAKTPDFLFSAVRETVAAQIAVNPLILGHFGRLSLIALLPNVLIVPIIPIPMILSIFIGVAANFWSSGLSLLAVPLDLVLRYILYVISFFDKVPYASLEVKKFSWSAVFIIYLFIFCLIFLFYRKFLNDEDEG